jgi:flavin reductase (DIM6/NTAB) family NADH-FMN oxidoreductase RutF
MVSEQLTAALTPVLGRIPSGVFILIARSDDGKTTGLLASFIQQASFDPPQVTVAVNKTRYLNSWLKDGSPVSLNQVQKGDNVLFRHFGKGFDPDSNAFDGIEWSPGLSGLPLLKNAMACMEGIVSGRMEAGDHIIYLVSLTNAVANRDAAEFDPYVHIRKNGFSY